MTAEQMWKIYRGDHPEATRYEAWAFCGGGEVGDLLAQLTLDGTKTATASSLLAYQAYSDPIPTPGCLSVILNDQGEAVCIIRDTRVTLTPFDEAPARHAYLEGEGDRSLAYWREVHREAFAPDYQAAGLPFDEHGLCVLEEFEVVYRPEV